MTLTLFSSAGVTGLPKTASVAVDSLHADTRAAIFAYFDRVPDTGPKATTFDSWVLDDGREARIHPDLLPPALHALYTRMRGMLQYTRPS